MGTRSVELTEEQCDWIGVAVATCKARAIEITAGGFGGEDEEDVMDGIYLTTIWTDLERIFPEPTIALRTD